jgi:membrane-associated protease RseP (regulator of RpoE activity)
VLSLLGVVAFVLALVISVALHEAGHLVTAKHYGMKASEYFIGFGPKIFSFRRGETEYGLKAVLAGGYVKIIGMTTLEEVPAGDEDRVFYKQPAGRRAVVLCAGSAVHLVIAVALVFAALWMGGNEAAAVPGTSVSAVLSCAPKSVLDASCPPHAPASPAKAAGLRAGDQLVAIDGRPVTGYQSFVTFVRARADQPITLEVRRDGRLVTLRATPTKISEPIGNGPKTHEVGFLGISPDTVVPHYGFTGLFHATATTLGSFFTGTVTAVHHLPSELTSLAKGKPRTGNGPAGVIDLARISSEIARAPQTSVVDRLASFLLLVAELNFFVGLFNLLPLLPLDGGHVGILAFEQARSRLARLLGRPDPGRVDLVKVLPFAYTVIALFAGLTLLLVYAGIANPLRLQ